MQFCRCVWDKVAVLRTEEEKEAEECVHPESVNATHVEALLEINNTKNPNTIYDPRKQTQCKQ